MRFILLLTAAAGAAAIGTAAAARPGGGAGGPGLKVGFSNAGGHHSAGRVRTRFGIGRIEIEPRRGRHHRRYRDHDHDHDLYAYGGGFGVGDSLEDVDPYGNGFFAGGGGQIELRGGRPYFDYDRSYPYEWAPAARRSRPAPARAAAGTEPGPRCTFENGVRVCRGW